jgi:error-prone DNA polymerase
MEDLVRCVPEVTVEHLESLATAGAFQDCFGLDRRRALWEAGAVAQSRPDRLHGIVTGATAPSLPGMEPVEVAVADLWATGVAPDGHPTMFLRDRLAALGVRTATDLTSCRAPARVYVAGVVTHRQRPMTAKGTMFVNLEDETGLINVIVSKGCWSRFAQIVQCAPALVVRGRLERIDGAINVVAEHIAALPVAAAAPARDFR